MPAGVGGVILDDTLETSYRLGIEIVPTLIKRRGRPRGRTHLRLAPRRLAAHHRPVAASATTCPSCVRAAARRRSSPASPKTWRSDYGKTGLQSREIEIGDAEDPIEACYERGWSDGMPVVPPTRARVLRMLQGTTRKPDEVLGMVPPDLVPCTVEKVAINAVHGRLQARVHAGRAGRGRSRADRRVRHARRALHHDVRRPGRHRERAGREGASA